MKKFKALSIMIVLALLVVLVQPATASAAVKLSKSKATMYVGDSITLKVSGTKKSVTWSSSKKSVATVSSKGKVTAKKTGSATITAKVSGKSYTCKVTVKDKFSADNAAKSLKCKYYEYSEGVVAVITNNYSYNIDLTGTAVFYDSSDKMLDKSADYNYCLAKGATCVLFFRTPYDSDFNYVDYSTYKVNYSCRESIAINKSSDIEINYNDGTDNVMVEVTNKGDEKIDAATIAIIFFKEGNVIGYDYSYANCEEPGTSAYLDFDYPYDENYDRIVPDDYEIYLNFAYAYKW